MSVVIETTIGSMTVDLYTEERPRTSLNFLKLCKMKYYNFCPFHKIMKDFIAQSGRNIYNGREGGESIYYFVYGEKGRFLEAERKPKLKHDDLGTLSMVTNEGLIGSEFFLTLGKELDYLDKQHTVFGKIVEGIEILYKLNEILCDKEDRPYKDVLITHTVILFDPFDDLDNLTIPDRSPEPSEELLNSDSIYIEQGYDENYGKTQEQLDEEFKDKQAKSRAIILEMVGDLPEADVAPPDNVLFVCKLNAVTKEEDLEVIFSRFGKVVDCEVIRDSKTGESLQYAFIEFDDPKDCEQAYFKMDNVLIDDRRIHVDFSQSVAKFKWKKKMNKDELKEFDHNGRRRSMSESNDEDDKRQVKRNYRQYDDRRNDNRRYDNRYDDRRNYNRSLHRRPTEERYYSSNRYERDSRRSRSYSKSPSPKRRSRDKLKRRDRSTSRDRHKKRNDSRDRKERRKDHSKERSKHRSRSRDRNYKRRSRSNERRKYRN